MQNDFGEQQQLANWLALHRTPGVGPVTFLRLIEQFSDLSELFAAPKLAKHISERTLSALQKPNWLRVEQDLDWFNQPDRHIITLKDPRYPHLLKEIADPPSIIFAQGDIGLLSQWQLAIVGSRNPSRGGYQLTFDFAGFLTQCNLVINSGLAMGIDTAAHQGAIAAGGKTIAVIGTGLDKVYPASNRDLAHRITQQGLIVSEFALGTSPRPDNFPRRNRIISGLSLGTLVVEAAVQSGSLITARMALEQGREVFAIPGSIHNPLAKGCHRLIREGAKLVETANDILEELGALAAIDLPTPEKQQTSQLKVEWDEDYQALLSCLGYDPVALDDLIVCSGLTAEAVSSMLLLLELKGQVSTLPGGRYVRTS